MYDSILIYSTTWELIKELPEAEQLKVFTALCNKWFEDTEPNLNGMAGAVYNQANLLAEKAKNRYAAAVANGKKGGAPKGNQNARKQPEEQPENNLKTTRQTTRNQAKNNLNVNDNDNVKDNEKDKDKDKEQETVLFTPDGVSNTPSTLEEEYKLVFESIKTEEIRKNLEEWYSLIGKYETKLTPDILRARLKALGESCGNNPTIIAYSIKQATLGGWKVFYKKEPKAQYNPNSFKTKTQGAPAEMKPWVSPEEQKRIEEEADKEIERILNEVN